MFQRKRPGVRCEACNRGPMDGVSVFRQNPKGEAGIWRCARHNETPVDPEVARVVRAAAAANRTRTLDTPPESS